MLITGAAGFIGARAVERCNQEGIPLIAVDAPSYFQNRTEHYGLDFGEIVDREELFEWLEQERPSLEAVLHLGACTKTTLFDEEYFQRVNVQYSQKLWDYCTRHQLPFYYASSAATYGDGSHGYGDEEENLLHLRPLNPYGESKHRFDLWVLEQERRGICPPCWAGFKFFNVYGFGERHKKEMSSVVLKAYDQIRSDGRLRLFRSHRPDIASGEQKRDFIYVQDVVDVLFFAWQKPIQRGIFNVGTGRARTFLELAESVFHVLGMEPVIEFVDMPEEIREKYQYFTQAKMEKLRLQGYTKPFTPLEEGVRQYIECLRVWERETSGKFGGKR
ncbi:MAG: ADP-glyceromanno-heptose 6-epimerase [Planctomycetota bacterium]|nr:MAG: ADP-glyceromanno-heptose 6-epimerase [Planctomycetota bacterium]